MIKPITNFRPSVTPKQNVQNNQNYKKNGFNTTFKGIAAVVAKDKRTFEDLLSDMFDYEDFYPMIISITKLVKDNPFVNSKLTKFIEKGKEISIVIVGSKDKDALCDNILQGESLLKRTMEHEPIDLDAPDVKLPFIARDMLRMRNKEFELDA